MNEHTRYVLDIDGTALTQQKPDELHVATPLEGAVEGVNAAYDAGSQIVFYTNRNYKFMQLTHEQMRDFGFKFHHICFFKPHGDVIIDDRAERFTTWADLHQRGII